MKNRKAKKGFTIIELVIVIAVIGILAAVLIPTFSGVIDKANESAAAQNAKVIYEEASIAAAMGNVSLDGMYIVDKSDNYIYQVDGAELVEITGTTATLGTVTEVKNGMKIYLKNNISVKQEDGAKTISILNAGNAITDASAKLSIRDNEGNLVWTLTIGTTVGSDPTVNFSNIALADAATGWYTFTISGTNSYSGVFYLA